MPYVVVIGTVASIVDVPMYLDHVLTRGKIARTAEVYATTRFAVKSHKNIDF